MDQRPCSACGSADVEPGFLLGQGAGGGGRWIPGPLEKGPLGRTRMAGKEKYDVTAHRCRVCNHLDLYVEL